MKWNLPTTEKISVPCGSGIGRFHRISLSVEYACSTFRVEDRNSAFSETSVYFHQVRWHTDPQ
jgi:hypothetical protein